MYLKWKILAYAIAVAAKAQASTAAYVQTSAKTQAAAGFEQQLRLNLTDLNMLTIFNCNNFKSEMTSLLSNKNVHDLQS